MEKYITFILDTFKDKDIAKFNSTVLCESYLDTKQAIEDGVEDIWTYDTGMLSFNLIDKGYTNIMLCYRDNTIACYPGMTVNGHKIYKRDNLLKLLHEGMFDSIYEG